MRKCVTKWGNDERTSAVKSSLLVLCENEGLGIPAVSLGRRLNVVVSVEENRLESGIVANFAEEDGRKFEGLAVDDVGTERDGGDGDGEGGELRLEKVRHRKGVGAVLRVGRD